MFLLLPRFRLMARIALVNAIVHVLRRGGAERSVIEVHQIQRLFDVILEFVQSFQLLRFRRDAFPRRCFKEHLVTGT